MGKKLLLFLLILAQIPFAQAITSYDVHVQENDALINATFELYTSSPQEKVNYWTTSFSLPSGAEIHQAADSKGVITNLSISGNKVILETNKGGLREKEVISLLFRVRNVVDDSLPVKRFNLSLSGFDDLRPDVPDELTFVKIKTEEDMIAFYPSLGFVSDGSSREVKFQGQGPLAFNLVFGQGGKKYRHYVLFGEADLAEADNLYGIPVSVTGLVPEFERFPVIVLDGREYDRQVNDWSAGEYRGGVLFIRRSSLNDTSFLGTLLHEVGHGLNERALRWQSTPVAWFDEGVAKYVEFLVDKKSQVRQAEIFGKPLEWVEGHTIYSLPSRSSADELWDYYASGNDFMRSWSPENPGTREFGYAFSELVIRDFVNKGGDLQTVFQELLKIKEEAQTPEEYNAVLLRLLNSDFRPCAAPAKKQMENCLKEINKMNPPLPSNVTIKGVQEQIIIPAIEPPIEEPVGPQGIFEQIIEFFQSLIGRILALFGR